MGSIVKLSIREFALEKLQSLMPWHHQLQPLRYIDLANAFIILRQQALTDLRWLENVLVLHALFPLLCRLIVSF